MCALSVDFGSKLLGSMSEIGNTSVIYESHLLAATDHHHIVLNRTMQCRKCDKNDKAEPAFIFTSMQTTWSTWSVAGNLKVPP